jgi:hypothetical protein
MIRNPGKKEAEQKLGPSPTGRYETLRVASIIASPPDLWAEHESCKGGIAASLSCPLCALRMA